ncbi:MAG: methyl-accepting chemotaxis protein [Pseudanabaenaceae cyanobacterium SKYGB_i_bin29]|nr:methyl-accepting chemotaxis protein [Pseudanabaenaceae cyanobacterium SKYG29]MDW8422037.1 methyl-accepting chemotaxis protein [Pseudanabaenaceae cyanobacterium SKYGB_i_bin29]
MFDRLKLRGKILSGYAIPIVIAFLSTLLIFAEIRNTRKYLTDSRTANNLLFLLLEDGFVTTSIDHKVTEYLLSNARQSDNLRRVDELRKRQQELLSKKNEIIGAKPDLLNFDQVKDKIRSLEELILKNKQVSQRTLDLATNGKLAEATKLWFSSEHQQLIDQIISLTEEINKLVRETSTFKRQLTTNALNRSITFSLLGLLLTVLVSPAAGVFITRLVTRSISKTTTELASITSEIAASMAEQEKVISQQAVSVNQTTTTMEELGASSRQSAEQAIASSTNAQKSLELCHTGSDSVNKTLQGISTVKDKVTAIADKIVHLSEQTAQISTVSDLVADIANQTNILALNAAVEAARAGEQGKGFAVVAQEVRKLADQSKASADKISHLIREIQSSINSTVMVTDEGTKTANESMRLAQETLQAFESIVKAVETIAMNTQQIALSSKQQAVGVQQAVSAMNAINLAAKEASASVAQVKAAIQQLSESAQFLRDQI